MEFSPTTFFFEIINFLVLMALLKHWFYRPVLQSIERRKELIKTELASAEEVRQKALELQNELEEQHRTGQEELREERAKLVCEMKNQREQLQRELDEERVKAREAGRAELEMEARHNQILALEQGSRFATRLLTELADPRLQELIVEFAVRELSDLEPESREALRRADSVKVTSAFPLSENSVRALEEALGKVELAEDPKLMAGVALQAGDCYLGANLNDQLEMFRRTGLG